MAKGKRSPALFEVIHSSGDFDKQRRQSVLRTPKWWFKGRSRGGTATAVATPPVAREASGTVEHDPTAFAESTHAAHIARTAAADPTYAPEPEIDSEPDPGPRSSRPVEYGRRSLSHAWRRSPINWTLDRDRHEIHVRVRYTTAIVTGFALLVAIGLAYVTGRHLGRGPARLMASESSEDIMAGPITPGVLDVSPTTRTNRVPQARADSVPSTTGTQRGPIAQARPAPPSTKTQPQAALPKLREIGLQYVVIQSYPAKELKLAQEACDALNANGIQATVERGVPIAPAWHCVVGLQGFTRASGPQYEAYFASIEKVGEKIASSKTSFKRFEPTPVRWAPPANQ